MNRLIIDKQPCETARKIAEELNKITEDYLSRGNNLMSEGKKLEQYLRENGFHSLDHLIHYVREIESELEELRNPTPPSIRYAMNDDAVRAIIDALGWEEISSDMHVNREALNEELETTMFTATIEDGNFSREAKASKDSTSPSEGYTVVYHVISRG